nr:integrase, catalytic region, zinc finger, CCHC-type, peptidase aspartic, catalytic [Tanacetum cinerariifolium]
SGLELQCMTSATSSSGLVPNIVSQQPCIPLNRDVWDHLFQPMFDKYFNPPSIAISPVPVDATLRVVDLADSLVSASIDQDAPSISIPSTHEQEHSLNISQGFEESPKTLLFHNDPLNESPHKDSTSQGSSSNLDSGTTILQESRGMVTISWEMLLSKEYAMSKGLDITCFLLVNFTTRILKSNFRKNTFFIRNLEGVDLISRSRDINLYTISLVDMLKTSSICLLSKASKTKSWLWHHRLSHLNFGTLNKLAKDGLIRGIPRLKFQKDHLCSAYALVKSKKSSHQPKAGDTNQEKLYLLYMDVCGSMCVVSSNKERGALQIATACFTQNRSIIHRRFNKTPYELINGRKPDISFLHVFGALCYHKNDREDIGKLGAKGDIGFFIGYSTDSCAYILYNRRTKKIMETMNVSFDELSAMDFEQRSSKPGLQCMTSGQISSGLDLTYASSTITTQQPTEVELDLLFEAMYDDYFGGRPSASVKTVLPAQEPQV